MSEDYILSYVNLGPRLLRLASPKAHVINLRIGTLNARSVHLKFAHINDVITTERLDILVARVYVVYTFLV